jgi:hypothetical protein
MDFRKNVDNFEKSRSFMRLPSRFESPFSNADFLSTMGIWIILPHHSKAQHGKK